MNKSDFCYFYTFDRENNQMKKLYLINTIYMSSPKKNIYPKLLRK